MNDSPPMKFYDPFPLPQLGQSPTSVVDWERIANKVVHEVLRIEPGERIIIQANPYYHGALLEQVRRAVQKADAIELACMLNWTEQVGALRAADGAMRRAVSAARELEARAALFELAGVFIWLPHDTRGGWPPHVLGETEDILDSWPGRSVHFHWFHDPANLDPATNVNKALDQVYQNAILDLDYAALRASMQRLAQAFRNQTVHLATPAGTSLSFRLDEDINLNYGDASRGARRSSNYGARAKEEEIPCGAIRSIPAANSIDGVIVVPPRSPVPKAAHDYSLPPGLFDAGAHIVVSEGRVTEIRSGGSQEKFDRAWAQYSGDKDRVGEFVLGVNPHLRPVPGSAFPPYYGYGDGVVRIAIGDNRESGGNFTSNLFAWLLFDDATVSVNRRNIVLNGRLVERFAVPR